jgi:hypothetical protein
MLPIGRRFNPWDESSPPEAPRKIKLIKRKKTKKPKREKK